MKSQALKILSKYFGYTSFRPLQWEIINDFMEGKDVTVLMPTGGGKSLCYQIPALLKDGVLVVVSPLIALMKDQVEGLRANGVEAAYINSSMNSNQQQKVLEGVMHNTLDLVYISPEGLLSQDFFSVLKTSKIIGFAIDEAHCISSWGHDFRQEYTQLNLLKKNFPELPIIALTATADRLTRKDIVDQLSMENPENYIASFNRPNLSLNVVPGKDRIKLILDFLKERPNTSGIIYCLSRKTTERVAEKLQDKGYNALPYHAGLGNDVRSKTQEDFINDEVPIICATIAFGMGIDKSNVRWVLHYNLPKNMEGYYQEIGRAGRDGIPSDTILMYSYGDVIQQQQFIDQSAQKEFLTAKLNRLRNYTEARICRRKILLSYFGESLEEDCGNCDVCKHPPELTDGTIIAQMALSAIIRVKETEPLNTIINILRGAQTGELMSKGYHNLPTYGVGKTYSFHEWQHWMLQLLNLGYFEIAYDRHNALFVTEKGKKVLFEKSPVELVKLKEMKKAVQAAPASKTKKVSKAKQATNELFEVLRKVRKQLAEQEGRPPYQIFTDATLHELVIEQPTTDDQLDHITGIGEYKKRMYGDDFLNAIFNFKKNQKSLKGSTQLKTLDFLQQGLSVEEVAKKRDLSRTTIVNHIVVLMGKGHAIDVSNLIDQRQKELLFEYFTSAEKNVGIKEVFEHFNEKLSYEVIQIGRALFQQEKQS